jgi:AcrR family transcriptional regulator
MSGIEQRRQAARREPSENYEQRRKDLLQAAAGVFQEKGFEAVRMDDVAEQLNVDRASLYYYFGNKKQLFREVILQGVAEVVALARAIVESDEPARQKLTDLLTGLMDDYERRYPLLFVYIQEDMRRIATDDAPESVQLLKLGQSYEDMVKLIIEQGIAEGDFNPACNPSVVAYAILGAANWTHRWYRPDGRLRGAEVGAEFADMFLDGLLIGPARRRGRIKRIVEVPRDAVQLPEVDPGGRRRRPRTTPATRTGARTAARSRKSPGS